MSSKKDSFFIKLAKEVSRAGTCLRLQVGSVLVRQDKVLAVGYNGAPSGLKHCMDTGCDVVTEDGIPHCIRALHADQNALLNAAAIGVETAGATLYTTHSPCYTCAKMLIQAGISQVTYLNEYDNDKAKEAFKEANVERVRFQG